MQTQTTLLQPPSRVAKPMLPTLDCLYPPAQRYIVRFAGQKDGVIKTGVQLNELAKQGRYAPKDFWVMGVETELYQLHQDCTVYQEADAPPEITRSLTQAGVSGKRR